MQMPSRSLCFPKPLRVNASEFAFLLSFDWCGCSPVGSELLASTSAGPLGAFAEGDEEADAL